MQDSLFYLVDLSKEVLSVVCTDVKESTSELPSVSMPATEQDKEILSVVCTDVKESTIELPSISTPTEASRPSIPSLDKEDILELTEVERKKLPSDFQQESSVHRKDEEEVEPQPFEEEYTDKHYTEDVELVKEKEDDKIPCLVDINPVRSISSKAPEENISRSSVCVINQEPKSQAKATNATNATLWNKAEREELEAIAKMGVWALDPLPEARLQDCCFGKVRSLVVAFFNQNLVTTQSFLSLETFISKPSLGLEQGRKESRNETQQKAGYDPPSQAQECDKMNGWIAPKISCTEAITNVECASCKDAANFNPQLDQWCCQCEMTEGKPVRRRKVTNRFLL